MSPPSFDLVRCRVDGCEWETLTTTPMEELRQHLQTAHDYSDAEWADARDRLLQARRER